LIKRTENERVGCALGCGLGVVYMAREKQLTTDGQDAVDVGFVNPVVWKVGKAVRPERDLATPPGVAEFEASVGG